MCSWEIPSFLLIYRLNEILFFFGTPRADLAHAENFSGLSYLCQLNIDL